MRHSAQGGTQGNGWQRQAPYLEDTRQPVSQQKRVNCRCKADPNTSTRVKALISQWQASRNKAGQRAAEESIRAQHQRRMVWFWHGCGMAATQCGRQGGPFQPSPVLLFFIFFPSGKAGRPEEESETHEVHGMGGGADMGCRRTGATTHSRRAGQRLLHCCTTWRLCACVPAGLGRLAG
ncbi:hypothetical protein COCSADRAFT_359358 [Bipolaris sorokiniana ND90Pr]|uniref:Uncharacterized protein n=1 Tax=Cochliobolus sativus (strain ND90Pr / ATCC 201652) TaxID=665912 RepID=M2T2B0_COCSN|nr:uncharacterized protein COCSADRAFT_359358 [Bipolaris sorokiniana ND90Pr]EMD63147.1 hypothetical protein COCSADRAFT_359358 [Bipolaris sorokiniana ND90Pr]